MLTLGVDLAADPKRTAMCWIRWGADKATVEDAFCGADDGVLMAAFAKADRVGIDAPFGWPDAFAEAVTAHHRRCSWPSHDGHHLQYRRTDRLVRGVTGRWPLSVSSDRIGVTAMRCARLLSWYAKASDSVPRDGSNKLIEVYPAAALASWGQRSTGYKRGPASAEGRGRLVDWLRPATAKWLTASEQVWSDCQQSDDVLDAVLASLVTRAAAVAQCRPIPGRLVTCARREGWIAVPFPDSLNGLASSAAEERVSAG